MYKFDIIGRNYFLLVSLFWPPKILGNHYITTMYKPCEFHPYLGKHPFSDFWRNIPLQIDFCFCFLLASGPTQWRAIDGWC